MTEEDPIRWTERGAPDGALALLAELDEPPPLPSAVRRRVREAVAAEVRPGPVIRWRRLVAAAAVALLAFGAGWIAARETPAPEAVAAPIAPERSRPAEDIEEAEPTPEPPGTLAAGSEASEPEQSAEPEPRRRRATMRSATSPDLLDPFADRSAMSASTMGENPERSSMDSGRARALDPFANRPSPMRERGRVLDPFASGGEGATPQREPPTGELVINTIPWARVFVDGRDTGRNTPVRRLRLPAGTHRIGLRTVDGTMHEVTIDVRAGEVMRLMRRL